LGCADLRLEAREPLVRRRELEATTRVDRDSILLLSKRHFEVSKAADGLCYDACSDAALARALWIGVLRHAVWSR